MPREAACHPFRPSLLLCLLHQCLHSRRIPCSTIRPLVPHLPLRTRDRFVPHTPRHRIAVASPEGHFVNSSCTLIFLLHYWHKERTFKVSPSTKMTNTTVKDKKIKPKRVAWFLPLKLLSNKKLSQLRRPPDPCLWPLLCLDLLGPPDMTRSLIRS